MQLKHPILQPASLTLGPAGLKGFVFAFVAVCATTAAIGALNHFVDLGHVGALYLVPVLIAAMRWGLGPALLASGASTIAFAFFFYPPVYSFQVQKCGSLVV